MTENRKIFNMNQEHRFHVLISFSIFIVITLLRIFGVWGSISPLKKLKHIFSNTHFLLGFMLVAGWSFFILGMNGAKQLTDDNDTYNSYIEATKKAILAIIIAIFAKMELILPVFWLVWLSAFYLQGWS